MTAPMTSPAELLDRLDELHAAATPGPWAQSGTWSGTGVLDETGETVMTAWFPSDAALIVAAVNSLPALTAALRAVLALADELERDHGSALDDARVKKDSILTGIAAGYQSAATRLRTTLASALAADPTNQEGTP